MFPPQQQNLIKHQITKQKLKIIIGICMTKIGPSTAFLWFPNSLYYLSYCHVLDNTYTLFVKHITLFACFLVAGPLFYYAMQINRIFGTTTVAKICTIINLISVIIAYYTSSPALFLVLVVMVPLVIMSIITIPLLNVLYKYFNEQQNIVTGVTNFVLSIAQFIFAVSYFYIVNPLNKKPLNDNFFQNDVANQVPKAVIMVGMASSIIMIIGSFFLLPQNQYFESKEQNQLNFFQLPFCDFIYQRLYWITILLLIPLIYFNNNYKQFLIDYYSDQTLTYLYSAGFIFSTAGCLFWGYMAQNKGFGWTLVIVTIAFFIANCLLAISLNTKWQILKYSIGICVLVSNFIDRSIFVIMAPLIIKVFGTLKGSKLLTVKGSAAIFSYIVAMIAQFSAGYSSTALLMMTFVNIANPIIAFSLKDLY